MKKNYILTLFLSLLISGLTFGQTLMITTISDGDCSGGVPKMVEIYVQGEVNLSLYSLKNLSISSTSGTSSLNSFGTVTDDFIYVYYDTTTPEEVFATEYPSATPSIEATVASFNGDDVIRIVRNSDQTIIDQYGDTDGGIQDGTGTPWEYKDGYAKRINGTTSSGEFTIGDWNVVNGGLDGQGSCQGGTIFEDVMGGVGVYTAPVVYDLLEDFETALPAGALVGDSGMATTPEVVADPATGGTNGDVLKIVTSAAGNGWQNAQLFLQGDLLDLTTDDKVVTVDVYSESAFMMLAKTATPSNGGAESATDASHTGSGWETLTFDFSDPKDNTPVANDIFGRILFFPQWNGAGWNDSSVTTTYVDNIKGTGYTAPVVYDLLEDFETALPAGALVGDSGMATTPEVVADPATGGTNGDVLKIVTSAAGNGWQNAQLFLQGDLLDLTTDDKVVTVDVYSESAFMMLAKTATPSNGGAESATDASHTGSGWETLTFDFSDPKDNTPVANDIFGRILFFPQWNGAGWNDSSVTTTYVDNIKGTGYTAPVVVVYDLLEDFETALPAGALVGDSGMATTPEVVADPATGGTNGDVLKIVTSAAGNGWQNAQLFLQGDLLDLTTDDKVVTVDVYSESAFMMLAKTATPSNGGAESATDASHTGSGWETLTFDFSDPKDNTPVANDIFGRILFFPQWNGAGWNDSSVTTTYVDNIKGTGYTAPVVYDLLEDFETALPAGALVGDSGMATTPEVVADPATGGTNGDVLKIVTSAAGNGWQNAQLFLQGDLLDLTTDDKVVTVDVYSESAFMMLAKTATPSNGGAESATDASHTGSGWETLTFDFSDPKDNTPVANDIFGRILFFPQWNGAGWNDSSVTTTYVDNIKGIGYESTPPTGDNSVTIATTQAWNSYVNVFSVSDNSYQFGFGDIEVSDLRATATETSVTLEPNISIWTNESTNDAYFDQDAASQTPVAYIEASTYIENASLANNALTFSGNISTSDLGDDYTVIAFIKSLTSSYDQVAFKSVDISSTGDFTVTATAEEMSQAVIQYGFAVTGPLADPSDTTLGSVVIGAETLGIEDTDIVNVSVYPNPSNSNWNFRTPNTVITSVEVFNLLGKRVVLRKNNSTDIAISTQGLTSGIYIARITTEQGTKSVKLIKE
jgi:citrate lyase synthetase